MRINLNLFNDTYLYSKQANLFNDTYLYSKQAIQNSLDRIYMAMF